MPDIQHIIGWRICCGGPMKIIRHILDAVIPTLAQWMLSGILGSLSDILVSSLYPAMGQCRISSILSTSDSQPWANANYPTNGCQALGQCLISDRCRCWISFLEPSSIQCWGSEIRHWPNILYPMLNNAGYNTLARQSPNACFPAIVIRRWPNAVNPMSDVLVGDPIYSGIGPMHTCL